MEALFIYLLKSAGILTIFFLAYKTLLQKETFFSLNRHYLMGGIIASLLLPLVVFESYVYVDPIVIPEVVFYDSALTGVETAAISQPEPFDWTALLFNLYLIGMILASLQFLVQLISLFRIAKSGTLKRFKSFNLIEVSSNVSPFSFFNYIIYNPQDFSERDLEIILNHEIAHGKQLHSIDILVSQAFLILQWFNPIAWFYKRTIQQNLEFLADKEAISNIDSKKNYQHTLLKVSVASYCASITNNFYNSLIKKRIVMLNQKSSKTKNLWKYGLILPALALFLMSFNTKTIEIVKEAEASLLEPNNKYTHDLEDLWIPVLDPDPAPTAIASEKDTSKNTSSKQNDVIVKITKDTTKEELDQIQKDLREKGMEFSYGKLNYNASQEITSIRLKYKDKEFGNSGSYHVNGDDDEPIKPIFIYTKEDGGFGIGSSPDDRAHREHLREHETRMKEHNERVEVHQERMKEHQQRIKEEYEVRLEQRREHLEERKAKMEEKQEVRVMEMKERQQKMHKEHEVRMKEHKERKKEHEKRLKEVIEERRVIRDKDSSFVIIVDDSDDSNTFTYSTSYSSDEPQRVKIKSNGKEPLYVVNGKVTSKGRYKRLDPNNIASMNVLKGNSAISIYGDKGEDGVVQIVTKEKQSPWKVSYGVNAVRYSEDGSTGNNVWVYEEDASGKLFRINKNTTNETLNTYKSKLKAQGIDAKFTKIKRNDSGEITSIKVALKDKQGRASSATWRDDDNTIPTIRVGTRGGKLIASSSL